MRRIIGCAVIGSIILWRVFVLDDSWFSPATGFDLLLYILFLAPVAFFIGVIVFLILGLIGKIKLAEEAINFFSSVIGWALSGFGIASAIIIAASAYYDSPQGPFSIVFLDGPLGTGIGTVVGLILWLKNVEWKYSS